MKFDQYLKNIPSQRKQSILELLDLVKTMYPNSKPSMKYKMPTFTNGDGWVAIANQKNYISLYTCSPRAP